MQTASALHSETVLRDILKQFYREQHLELDQLIHVFQEVREEQLIPLSIFAENLPPAEALCKYLREKEKLSYKEIAEGLGRSQKSIWASYQRAKQQTKKKKSKFSLKPLKPLKQDQFYLPLSLFRNRSLSLLENAVWYLREVHRLKNKEIARLLHTSPNSVAVLVKRGREKNG
ncbi:sigma-70 region 4 domain-containing protein [Candidatus Woesearchaeota archaeon]|nr:sigma-70 region 4 domain-containing protein [Candidatus Woesearchaeota archaeon]